jgi:hypothetical protein
LNENENCFFNLSDYSESSNDIFFTDFLSSLTFENECQSEKSFINKITNFDDLNILSLNINILPSKLILDKINKSSNDISVILLQKIWDVCLEGLFKIEDYELFVNMQES